MSLLKKPYITTKSSILNKANKWCFIVDKKANKSEIKKIVKKQYGSSVQTVNTIVSPSKVVNARTKHGIVKGTKSAYKKVILTLSPGSTINMQ